LDQHVTPPSDLTLLRTQMLTGTIIFSIENGHRGVLLLKCFSKMNVRFYVRKSCTESKIIICIIKDHANMLRLSTEHTISVHHWDAKSQMAKKTMIGHEQLKDLLHNILFFT